MANYAVEYVKKMDRILEEERSVDEEIISDHLIKIGFFQHERFVHLIVTVLFAIMDIIMFAVSANTFNFSCILLMFFFTLLLIPYVFHYYFLENSVQRMYKQYEELKAKVN